MIVQCVVMPVTEAVWWTVLEGDGMPVPRVSWQKVVGPHPRHFTADQVDEFVSYVDAGPTRTIQAQFSVTGRLSTRSKHTFSAGD